MTTPLRQADAATTWESPNAIVRLGRSWLGRVLRLGQPHGLHPRPRLARPGTGAAGDRVQRGYWSVASSRTSALSPTATAWAPGCSRPSSGCSAAGWAGHVAPDWGQHEGGIHEPRCLEMRLIMLSPPGAGKGAHASQLSQTTGVAYISSGAPPRAEIARGGDLGRRFAQYTSRGDLTVFEGQRRGRLPTGGALAGGVELLQAAMKPGSQVLLPATRPPGTPALCGAAAGDPRVGVQPPIGVPGVRLCQEITNVCWPFWTRYSTRLRPGVRSIA